MYPSVAANRASRFATQTNAGSEFPVKVSIRRAVAVLKEPVRAITAARASNLYIPPSATRLPSNSPNHSVFLFFTTPNPIPPTAETNAITPTKMVTSRNPKRPHVVLRSSFSAQRRSDG